MQMQRTALMHPAAVETIKIIKFLLMSNSISFMKRIKGFYEKLSFIFITGDQNVGRCRSPFRCLLASSSNLQFPGRHPCQGYQ